MSRNDFNPKVRGLMRQSAAARTVSDRRRRQRLMERSVNQRWREAEARSRQASERRR